MALQQHTLTNAAQLLPNQQLKHLMHAIAALLHLPKQLYLHNATAHLAEQTPTSLKTTFLESQVGVF
jgi:hypothetical protein